MSLRATFAVNLRRVRRARGLSQEALAHLAEVERSYIGKLENEVFAVSLDTLERLAAALEVNASDLLAPPQNAARRSTKRS